jgi:hypothetical protein
MTNKRRGIKIKNLLVKFKKDTRGAPIVEIVVLLCIAAYIVSLLFPSLRDEVGDDFNDMTGNTEIAIGGNWTTSGVLGQEENISRPPIFDGPISLGVVINMRGPQQITTYTPVKFKATPSGGTAPYTMVWTSYNGKTDGSEGPGQTFPLGLNKVTVEVTDAVGDTETYDKEFTVGAGYFTYSTSGAFATITGYSGNAAGIYDVIIPGEIGGKTVNTIGLLAFDYKNITSVKLPASVTKFENYAFRGNKLTSFDLPATLVDIPRGMFHFNQLASIKIPSTVKSIGYDAFSQNSLTSVTIPDSVTTMGAWAFEYNQLQSVVISKNIVTLPAGAFFNNKLTSVTLPEGMGTIGADAFSQNKLTSITVPSTVTSIGTRAFANNQLTTASFLNSTTTLAASIFYNNLGVPANLTIKAANPSTAKNYAATIGYSYAGL